MKGVCRYRSNHCHEHCLFLFSLLKLFERPEKKKTEQTENKIKKKQLEFTEAGFLCFNITSNTYQYNST